MSESGSDQSEPSEKHDSKKANSMRKQIRGSTLLLGGRGCSLVMNLVTQIVIVRALSRTDYGALAYTISIVEMLSIVSLFALDKTVLRFGAIYQEQKDFSRFAGALVLATAVPVALGSAIIAALMLGGASMTQSLSLDATSWPLLMVVCVLIPANGFASVSLSLITVVKGARSVFFRKHLLSPALKLIMVVLAAAFSSDPMSLAIALLAAGLCGLLADIWLVRQLLVSEQLTAEFSPSRIVLPVREFFGYSLSVLASDLSFMVRGTLLVVLLGWLGTREDTAALRAMLPLVRLNELVLLNFMVLFVPAASRMFASSALNQLWDTHRQTNLWIMALSFPLFAATAACALPLTVLMFGSQYADASRLLVVLATGYYIQAMYGLNGHLLRVLGRVRLLLGADIVGGTLLLVAAVIMIPIWGALGAAVAAAAGIVVHSHLRSMVLRHVAGTKWDSGNQVAVLLTVLMTACVTSVSLYWSPGWIAGGLLAVVTSVTVLLVTRDRLGIHESFPELRRIPFASLLLSGRSLPLTDAALTDAALTEPALTDGRPTKLAYMMSRFPKITETFILREMVEMRRLGITVGVYPLQRERTKVVHPETSSFMEHACFTPWISCSIAFANMQSMIQHPVRYVSTFASLLRANWGSGRYLIAAVLFFPKTVFLGEQMKRDGIQHVHAHFASHPAMAAWVIHQLTGIPFSFTAHGSDLHRDRHMLREKVRDAQLTITISEYNRQLILSECGEESADRIHVVHCGIDPQLFPVRKQLTSFDQGRGPFQLVCIGTLHEVKGQQHLLRACSRLAEEEFDFVCHLIGDGPDLTMLQNLAGELNLTQQVVFHGRRTATEIQKLLTDIDVIVAPSVPTTDGRREGIPVVLMEGLGSGIPAIGSDLSGIPELIRPFETGLLTPPGDVDAIADALLLLATDEELRRHCATSGSELVQQQFHVGKNTRALLQLIQAGPPSDGGGTVSDPVQQIRTSETPENAEAECLV